jgi:1-deoxy-D-xylulose-5-phosphate reductoisomerase
MQRVLLLGSTGSIGTSTLDVIGRLADRFEVVALTAGRNVDLLCDQVARFRPRCVCVHEDAAEEARARLKGDGVKVLAGMDGLMQLVVDPDMDVVVNGLVAGIGVRPTLAAIDAGKDVAIANKEVLVVAGELVTARAQEKGVRLLPIDSELTPLWMARQKTPDDHIARVLLPASGGPFFDWSAERMALVTTQEALNHPTWQMGPKITIDSATLMNKGFEVIEAHWFLNLPVSLIDVVVHRQSIVHCLMEYIDGGVTAYMSSPDMRLPIQQALTYPEMLPSPIDPLDLPEVGQLDFYAPDADRFPCLSLCYAAVNEGGTAPAVLNAANEVGVASFLEDRIRFTDIARVVSGALEDHCNGHDASLEALLDADRWARKRALEIVEGLEN